MKHERKIMVNIVILVIALGMAGVSYGVPMGTAFTYQGWLMDKNNNKPADGDHDFQFSLFAEPSDANQVGGTISKDNIDVQDGYFMASLDFGDDPNIFNGDARWLQIDVRPDGGGSFTTLSPRQELTPVPYSIYSKSAGSISGGTSSGSAGMQDAIIRGFELTYGSATYVYVNSGTLFHGHTSINKTGRTLLTLATASDWWDGNIDSYSGSAGWCYIGVDGLGDIRFLGDNSPNRVDTEGNIEGTKLYWFDGSNYWRLIGAVWIHTNDTITKKWFQRGNIVMWDVPVNITASSSTSWSSATTCTKGIPGISTMGIFGLWVGYTGVDGIDIWIRPNGSTWSPDHENAVYGGFAGATNANVGGQRWCATDISQQIQHRISTGTGGTIDVEGYVLDIR